MNPALEKHGKDIVAKVGAVFLFEIKPSKDAEPVYYTIDLKNGNGKSKLFQYSISVSTWMFNFIWYRQGNQGQRRQG